MAKAKKVVEAAVEDTAAPVETFEDVQVVVPEEPQQDQKLYLKTFEHGIHVEYVVKGSVKYLQDGSVSMVVKFSHFDEELPFCAQATDIYEHGTWLYDQALAGTFGKVVEWEKPLPTSHDLQTELDKLMVDITLGLATEEELDLARNLRKQIKVMTA